MVKFETVKMMKQFSSIFLTFILISLALLGAGCSFFSAKSETKNANSNANTSPNYKEAKRIATIQDDAVRESSGLAASHKNAGAFWTHNDSGDGAFLYAFDRAGKKLGTWKVAGAESKDWEDLAIFTDNQTGESYLLIGDIGNNERTRNEIAIYRVAEPQIMPEDAGSTKKNPRITKNAEKIRVEYPDMRRDAETLLVNPANGDLYIVSKSAVGNADIYKLPAPFDSSKKHTLRHVGQIGVPSITPGFLTGGSISPDGKRMILCDYLGGYEFVLPVKAKNFDEIWKAEAEQIHLGERTQGEAVTYSADGKAIYATSEKKPTPLIEVQRK